MNICVKGENLVTRKLGKYFFLPSLMCIFFFFGFGSIILFIFFKCYISKCRKHSLKHFLYKFMFCCLSVFCLFFGGLFCFVLLGFWFVGFYCCCFGAGDWNQSLTHAKHMLYSWSQPQATCQWFCSELKGLIVQVNLGVGFFYQSRRRKFSFYQSITSGKQALHSLTEH